MSFELSQDVLEVASFGLAEDLEEFCVALGEQLIHAREGAGRFGRELDPVAPAVARVEPPGEQDGDHPVVQTQGRDLRGGLCADRRRDAVYLRREELLFSGFGH